MRFSKTIFVIYMGLLGLTTGYCWLVFLGLGVFSLLITTEFIEHLPVITTVTADFSFVSYWQILVGISLVLNLYWGMVRSKNQNSPEGHVLPITCHIGFIFLCFSWNAVGVLASFVWDTSTGLPFHALP